MSQWSHWWKTRRRSCQHGSNERLFLLDVHASSTYTEPVCLYSPNMPATSGFLSYVDKHEEKFIDRLAEAVAIPSCATSSMPRHSSLTLYISIAFPFIRLFHVSYVYALIRRSSSGFPGSLTDARMCSAWAPGSTISSRKSA
jgi:hypothetical protein